MRATFKFSVQLCCTFVYHKLSHICARSTTAKINFNLNQKLKNLNLKTILWQRLIEVMQQSYKIVWYCLREY